MAVSARDLAHVRLKVVPTVAAGKASEGGATGGADNSTFMTPLRTKQQIDGRLADQETAEAGDDNVDLMTSLRTAQSILVNAESGSWSQAGTGAGVRMIREKLREIVSPEDFAAPGDGTADDTAAFNLASAPTRLLRGTPGKTYVLSDFVPPVNATIDLTGCYIKRGAGAKRIMDLNSFHGTIIGGDFNGGAAWKSTTTSAGAAANATTVTVASATGLQAGMKCVYASDWRSGREINEIASVVGTTVTLTIPLRGNVASGAKFLADFPLIRMSGPSLDSGSFRNAWVRNCLFGIQKGETGVAGVNSFGTIENIRVSDFIGAGILMMGNTAGEAFTDFVINASKTSTTTATATAGQTRFAYPWTLTKVPDRWGTERSIRVTVNGSQVANAGYTVDTASGEVVLTTPATGGETVVTINNEFAAFGIWANSANRLTGSSLERATSGIVISAAIGCFIESSELGYFGNVVADTCSYAALLVSKSSFMQFAASGFLFSPFPVIFDSGCVACSIGMFRTSIMPDSAQITPTAGKKDIIVESGATDIVVDFMSWGSTTYLSDVPVSTMGSARRASLHPGGIFIGAPVSGILADIRAANGDNAIQISADGKTLTFGSTSFNYIQNGGANATLRLGAIGASGATEIACGAGVAFKANADGTLTSFGNRINTGGAAGPQIRTGSGSPEGVVTAPIGSIFNRSDGSANTSIYVKESGTGNTGWVAK